MPLEFYTHEPGNFNCTAKSQPSEDLPESIKNPPLEATTERITNPPCAPSRNDAVNPLPGDTLNENTGYIFSLFVV